MKKYENNFAVTGYVAKDAEVYQFTNTSVARFPLAVARQEKINSRIQGAADWVPFLAASRRSAKKPSAYPLS